MKALQIGFALVVGLVYISWSLARPDLTWPLRIGAIVLIVLFLVLTNVLRGRPALESNNPLEADEVPSLNLAAPRNDESTEKSARSEAAIGKKKS